MTRIQELPAAVFGEGKSQIGDGDPRGGRRGADHKFSHVETSLPVASGCSIPTFIFQIDAFELITFQDVASHLSFRGNVYREIIDSIKHAIVTAGV